MYIVIAGTPNDGFAFTGPFDSHEEALEWAENARLTDDWWIAPLDAPAKPH